MNESPTSGFYLADDIYGLSLPPLVLDRGQWVCPIAGEGYEPANSQSLQQLRRLRRARARAVARIKGLPRPVSPK